MSNRSPNSASFFTHTMPIFQRGGSMKLFDTLARYLQDTGAAAQDYDMQLIIDTIEIENFISSLMDMEPGDALTSSQIEAAISEIKETYFLEESRYSRYYEPLIPFEELEKSVEEAIDLGSEGVSIEEAARNFVSSISGLRGTLNKKVEELGLDRRNRVSMGKDSVEMISRGKKIFETLGLNGVVLDKDNTLEGFIGRVSKEVIDSYIAEVDDISALPLREQIEAVGAAVKKYAVAFSDIKKGKELSGFAQQLKDSNDIDIINSLPALRGLTNPGLDFLQRITVHLKKALLDEGSRRRSSGKVRTKGQKGKEPVSKDKAVKDDLRDLLISALKASEIEINANSRSLFVNKGDIMGGDIGLDKDLIVSPLNMTLSAEGENLKILKLLADFSQVDDASILSAVNGRPQERIEELQKKIQLANVSGSKTEAFEREIDQIRKVQRDFARFVENHGEYMSDFVEKEFLKLLNYTIYVYQANAEVRQNVSGSPINVKEKYSLKNAKTYFSTIEEAVDVLDILISLKQNARVLGAGLPQLSTEQMLEVRGFLKNPSASGLAMGSETLETLVGSAEPIMATIEELIIKTAPKKGKSKGMKK